jgi:hypothetical protein
LKKIRAVGAATGILGSGFFRPPEPASHGLKNHLKILFIQQLDSHDFALGAWRLSWHK